MVVKADFQDKAVGVPEIDYKWSSARANEFGTQINANEAAVADAIAAAADAQAAADAAQAAATAAQAAAIAAANAYTDILRDETSDALSDMSTEISTVDGQIRTDMTAALAGKANTSHTHTSASITDFAEAAQDALAAALAGTSGVTVTYDDTANTITITGSGGGGGTDLEAVRDAIGVALIGVGNITVTANDALDTITISTTATQNDTNAALRDRTTHTGEQPQSSVTGLVAALAAKLDTVPTVNVVYVNDGSGVPATLSYRTSATAASIVQRDAQANITADAFIPTVLPVTSSGGTTTLTNDSPELIIISGSAAHNIDLPATTTVGRSWTIIHGGTSGTISVRTSTAATVAALGSAHGVTVKALTTTPTAASNWNMSSQLLTSAAGRLLMNATDSASQRVSLGNVKSRNTPAHVTSATTAGAVGNTDYVYFLDSAAGVLAMPTAVSNTGAYFICNTTGAAINITPFAGQQINAAGADVAFSLPAGASVILISDNAGWRVF